MLTLALFIIGITLTAQFAVTMPQNDDNLPRISILFIILGITALYAGFYTLVSFGAAILGTVATTVVITMVMYKPAKNKVHSNKPYTAATTRKE